MKRPIVIATLGFIIGIVGGLYRKIVPFIFAFLCIGIFIKYSRIQRPYKFVRILKIGITKKGMIVLTLFVLFGYFYMGYLEKDYETIFGSLEKAKTIKIEGTIITEKEEKTYSDRYVIKVKKINGKKVRKRKFLLTINKKKMTKSIKYGDLIKVEADYSPPEKQRNYHGFNEKQYYKTEKMYGTFKEKGSIEVIRKKNIFILFRTANTIKNKIIHEVDKSFSKETKGLFLGILLGEKKYLTEDVKEDFTESNLSHLLAVSGTHISCIVLGLRVVLRWFPISKRKQYGIISILLFWYFILIGFQPSLARAVIMYVFALFAKSFFRKQDIATSIAFSGLLILLYNPYQLVSIGFLLSFFGVMSIVLFLKQKEKKNKKEKPLLRKIKNIIKVTLVVQALILPISICSFHTIYFTFLLSNILASFFLAPVILIGVSLSVICLFNESVFSFLSQYYQYLLKLLMMIIKLLARFPLSKVYLPRPYAMSIGIYYFIISILWLSNKIKKSERPWLRKKYNYLQNTLWQSGHKIVILLIVLIILISSFLKLPGDLKIYFIDVGQGDSCLVITPHYQTILIDGGGSESYDVGKNTLLPYLLNRRVTRINYMIISHFDTDHVGGLLTVMEELKVDKVVIGKQGKDSLNYDRFKRIVKEKKIKVIVVEKRR